MNKRLGKLMKVISFLNMTVIIITVMFSLLYLKNSIHLTFLYNTVLCTVFAILLLSEGNKIERLRERRFYGKEKFYFSVLVAVGTIMTVMQNIMFFQEISGYEKGISCVILSMAAFTFFNSVVKMIKKNEVNHTQ